MSATTYYVNTETLNGRARPTVKADPPRVVRHRGDKIAIVRTLRGEDHFLWGESTGRNWWRMQFLSTRRPAPEPPARISTPVPGHVVTTPWGKKPPLDAAGRPKYWKARGHHTGVDYSAATGQPVIAVRPGEVVRFSNAVLGKIALLYTTNKDGKKVTFWYCHLSKITETGPVRAGQQIGLVGETGSGALGSHLHLEVRSGHSSDWSGTDRDPTDEW
jgi:murein DD-endopeptidase MepM/ murein hydrolase activator NlpD